MRLVRVLAERVWGRIEEDKGTAVVMVAVAAIVLFAMAAFVVDVGAGYAARARVSALVDAAALAGAQELPDNPAQAVAVARKYASANGIPGEEVSVTVSPDKKSLLVAARKEVNFFFGPLLGKERVAVGAQATARAGPAAAAWGVAPFGVEDMDLKFGTEYVLKYGAGDFDPSLGSGNYGALALNMPGASRYKQYLEYGYPELVRVGDVVATETGVISNSTLEALKNRMLRCPDPDCSFETFGRDCTHVLIVPMYRPVATSGLQIMEIEVVGFAAFYIERIEGQGKNNYVHGRFVKTVVAGIPDPSQKDYGVTAVSLVQ